MKNKKTLIYSIVIVIGLIITTGLMLRNDEEEIMKTHQETLTKMDSIIKVCDGSIREDTIKIEEIVKK